MVDVRHSRQEAKTITGDVTLDSNDNLLLLDASSASIAVTLPLASTWFFQYIFEIVDDTNAITFVATWWDTVPSPAIVVGKSYTIQSNWTTEWVIVWAELVFGTTAWTAVEWDDDRIPTQDESDALEWTDWTPSSSNKYVTNSDSRLFTTYRSISVSWSEVAWDDIISCDPTWWDIILDLLTAAWSPRVLTIKYITATNSNSVFIAPNWAETIDWFDSYELDTLNESIIIVSDGSNRQVRTSTRNEWQVKINTWNWVKPTLVYAWGTVETFQQITYATPLWLSWHPTTTWPKNIDVAGRTEAELYDFVNDTFLENKVPWQINTFRVIVDYSGKSAWLLTWTILKVENTLSWFVAEDTRTIPSESTSWSIVFLISTVADSASLPSPFGTWQWYELSLYSDDPITFEVDSILRISSKK